MVNSQSTILSNVIECSYCKGREKCNYFNILDDELYELMILHRKYDRQSLFCETCINRARRKLNVGKRKRKSNLQRNGNTYQTISRVILPSQTNISSRPVLPDAKNTSEGQNVQTNANRSSEKSSAGTSKQQTHQQNESISSTPSVTAGPSNLMQPSRTRTPTATTHTLSRHESDQSISSTSSVTAEPSNLLQPIRTRTPTATTHALSRNESDSFTTAPMPKNRPMRLSPRSSISSFPQELSDSQQLFGRGLGG